MGANVVPQKTKFHDTIKAFLIPGSQNVVYRTESLAPKLLPHAQNGLHHPFSCRFQEPIRRAKYAYVVVLLQFVLVKSYSVLNSPHPTAKNVSSFACERPNGN